MWSCGIQLMAISQKTLKKSILDMSLEITNLRSQTHLPGADEVMVFSKTKIYWENHFAVIQVLRDPSPHSAVRYVQKICADVTAIEWNEISIKLGLQWMSWWWNGPPAVGAR